MAFTYNPDEIYWYVIWVNKHGFARASGPMSEGAANEALSAGKKHIIGIHETFFSDKEIALIEFLAMDREERASES